MTKDRGKSQSEIRVYYRMEGTNEIHSDVVKEIKDGRVTFKDGGWCPAQHCFLTESQCRASCGLPNPDEQTVQMLRELRNSLRDKTREVAEAVRRLTGEEQ